jgi:hypothetical protein
MKTWIKAEEILNLMKAGWELGSSHECSGRSYLSSNRSWLQRNGLCKGGDVIDVHSKTIDKLLKENLIESFSNSVDPFWLIRYKIKGV